MIIVDVFREVARQIQVGLVATFVHCMFGWLLAFQAMRICVCRGWFDRQESFGLLGVYTLSYVLWLLYWKLWLFL